MIVRDFAQGVNGEWKEPTTVQAETKSAAFMELIRSPKIADAHAKLTEFESRGGTAFRKPPAFTWNRMSDFAKADFTKVVLGIADQYGIQIDGSDDYADLNRLTNENSLQTFQKVHRDYKSEEPATTKGEQPAPNFALKLPVRKRPPHPAAA